MSLFNDTTNKKGPRGLIVSFLLVAFTALFSVGCGSSDNGFVATGGGTTGNTGDLVFQFTKAQAIAVPTATTDLDFDFFDVNNNSVFFDSQLFANTVVVQNVPVTATRVVITARGPGGVPLALIESPVTVLGGGSNTVNLSGALVTPVTLDSLTVIPNPISLSLAGGPTTAQIAISGNFSNGDIVALGAATGGSASFTDFDALIATVDANGLVTAIGAGSTSVDVSYTLNGATVTLLDVPVNVAGPLGQLIVQPQTLQFAPGGIIGAIEDLLVSLLGGDRINNIAFFRAYFIPPNETEPVEVTSRVGVTFSNFFPSTVTADSFTHLNLFGEGIGITSNPFAPQPPFGATATMTVTYIEDGQVFTDNVDITLDNPQLSAVDVVTAPGGTLTLPSTSVDDFPVVAFAVYGNGLRFPIALGGGPFSPGYPDTFTMAIQPGGAAAVTLDNGNSVIDVNGGAAGQTAVLEITANGDPTPLATFNVVLNGGQIDEVALNVPRTDINPSGSYSVVGTFADGATQDLTAVYNAMTETTVDGGEVEFLSLLDFTPSGRLLGTAVGMTNVSIDGNSMNAANVTGFIQGGLGLTASQDTDGTNNNVIVNVLSRVPVALF